MTAHGAIADILLNLAQLSQEFATSLVVLFWVALGFSLDIPDERVVGDLGRSDEQRV